MERGIPFVGAMVLALLDGRKTRTRRLVNPQPVDGFVACPDVFDGSGSADLRGGFLIDRTKLATVDQPKAPYATGDRLWLREHWRLPAQFDGLDWPHVAGHFIASGTDPAELLEAVPVIYCADGERSAAWSADMVPGRKRIPRFMPRALSRAFLKITGTTFERVQDITEAEAMAEGALLGEEVAGVFRAGAPVRWVYFDREPATGKMIFDGLDARQAFEKLWDALHGGPETGWTANPWVAAYSFDFIKNNIDKT